MKPAPRVLAILATLLLALPARAQMPAMLKYTVPAPPVGVQSGAHLGTTVAIDGPYVAVAAPDDDAVDENAGAVKIFDSTTGALRFVLTNPNRLYSPLGYTVAISGNTVVLGLPTLPPNGAVGTAYVYDLSGPTPTVPVLTLSNPDSIPSFNFAPVVAISGTRVVVGVPFYNGAAQNVGRAYVYDLAGATPAVPILTVENPHPVASGVFGGVVAISDTRVLISAADDGSGLNAGCVYFYDLASATPTVPVASLSKPNLAAGDSFGAPVISGTLAAVGATGDDTLATNAGNVYIYDLASAAPGTPILALNKPGAVANSAFGAGVALSGTHVVVPAAEGTYVFDLAGATPATPVALLTDPNPTPQDHFGNSVAIDGTRVVIGAPNDDTGATDAGSAYVFELTSVTPNAPIAQLNNPGPGTFDQFGTSVALSGTLMVVGAPGYTFAVEPTSYVQSVYVYDLASATPLVPIAALRNPNPTANDYFGGSVAIDGTRVVVGAIFENTGAADAGSVYVYDLASATPGTPILTLHNPTPAASDYFGNVVAISGSRVVVGAPFDDTGATDSGSAYIYDLTSATPTVPVLTLNNPTPASGDLFGRPVVIEGTRVVVGASSDNTGTADAGSAYVYDLASATPTVPVRTLNNPAPAAGDNFGNSIALSGSRIVIGASGDDAGANNAGSAYVYDLNSATPTVPVVTLNNPAPGDNDSFGSKVAISGTRLVIGAQTDQEFVNYGGSAYVYDLAGATPATPVATLRKANLQPTDQFGSFVAILGNTIAIGVPNDSTQVFRKGTVYVYTLANPNDLDDNGLLDAWESAHFPVPTGHHALDDDDHDGLNNLLEEAFDTDPLQSSAPAVPAAMNEGGYLTMTIVKRAGVTYEVQSAATPDPAAFSPTTTTVLVNNATTLKVRDNFPVGTTSGRYLRVKVTATP